MPVSINKNDADGSQRSVWLPGEGMNHQGREVTFGEYGNFKRNKSC